MKFSPTLSLLVFVGGTLASSNTTEALSQLASNFHPGLQPKEKFAKTAPGSKAGYHVRQQYNSTEHFFGVSVAFEHDVNLATLKKTAGVKNAWSVTVVPRPGSEGVNETLEMAGVDKLHKEGIKGKGVQVAILDTGVDYNHPSQLYRSQLPCAIDPLSTCIGGEHGTHTTGIVGMEDPDEGFILVGVAPEATIAAYRIFGCNNGGTTNDIVIAAMVQAVQDGADVVSVSLVGGNRWELDSPFDGIVTQLVNSGVAVVAAIGNIGIEGLYWPQNPGLSYDTLSVASVKNGVFPVAYTAHDDQKNALDYVSQIYTLGTGLGVTPDPTISSGCDASSTIKWNNIILLVSVTESCVTLLNKWDDAAAIGVKTMIVYLADNEQLNAGLLDGVQTLYLNHENSKKFINIFDNLPADQTSYYLTFDGKRPEDVSNELGPTVNAFFSYGPTVEMALVPKISSPGGNILSTWPLEEGGYALLSRISIAAPFIAASAALLKSQQPNLGTGRPLVASMARQGGGLVDAYAAVHADSVVSLSKIDLRDSASPAPQEITITKHSNGKKTYQIGHISAAFTRPATFEAQITPQEDKWPYWMPVYAGYVKVSSDNETYSIPYIGSLASPPVYKFEINNSGDKPAEPNLDKYNLTGSPDDALPLIDLSTGLPSRLVHLELVSANTSFVLSIYGFDPDVTIDYQLPDLAHQPGFLGEPSYEIIPASTMDPVSSIVMAPSRQVSPTLKTDNNTSITLVSGDYRPLFRALLWNGNESNPADF
ncbi:peptidase S8/S53 domain-containing protein [Trichoderma austrokoningii]